MVCEEFYFLVKNSGELVNFGENKRYFCCDLRIFLCGDKFILSVEKNEKCICMAPIVPRVIRGSESIRRLKQFDPKMLAGPF